MSARRRILCWYAFCRDYLATPEQERPKVRYQVLAQYRAIHRLPKAIGEALDERRAPQVVVRWIAWARDYKRMEDRYAVALEYNACTGRWPSWDELCELDEPQV